MYSDDDAYDCYDGYDDGGYELDENGDYDSDLDGNDDSDSDGDYDCDLDGNDDSGSDDRTDDDDDDDDFDHLEDVEDQKETVYLEYDGASKGNPGRAGAGAVLKYKDGTVITRLRRGLGNDTNNGAEYKALIEGMKTALDMGFDNIHVKGDSQLVHKQVQGEWQTRNEKMSKYCSEAKKLKSQFKSFNMEHVPRGSNKDADAEANKAVNLPPGHVEKEGGSRPR